jgi:hypothetical protein
MQHNNYMHFAQRAIFEKLEAGKINPIVRNPFEEIRGYADGRKFVLEGHLAWTLIQFMQAGDQGCTPADLMAPGLSQIVHQLRKVDLTFATIPENDPRIGKGFRLRYVLRSKVSITDFTLKAGYRYGV